MRISDEELRLRRKELKRRKLMQHQECVITYRDLQLWPHVSNSAKNHVKECEPCRVMVTPSCRFPSQIEAQSQPETGWLRKIFQWFGEAPL